MVYRGMKMMSLYKYLRTWLYILQLDEQKFEMDKLKRSLEEKIGEIQQIKGILQACEKVGIMICVYLNEHKIKNQIRTKLSDIMD